MEASRGRTGEGVELETPHFSLFTGIERDGKQETAMLAQNFKTAAELDLPEVEWRSLVKVLHSLETGTIGPEKFDMSNPMRCGTVGCIGGWVAKFMGTDSSHYLNSYASGVREEHPLRDLYWPGSYDPAYAATTDQAADAIRRFLVAGEVQWRDVMRANAETASKS